MEKRLKSGLMLPLKEMALRRVAVLLWNDSKIPKPFSWDVEWKHWQDTLEDKVKDKITKLQLPESLRKEMIDKVRPISLEIRKWRKCLHTWLQIPLDIGLEKLYWTTAGTIDHKKTAESLVGCDVLEVEKRYKLASAYCLEDSILRLWEELAEDRKKCFRHKTKAVTYMEVCWPRILKGDLSYLNRMWKTSDRNLTSFNQCAFEHSARECNKTAAEYFFRKMTHEEREASLMRTTLNELSGVLSLGINFWFSNDICCFLLSLMTPEQQMQTIKENPVAVLWCFSVMFWQDLLVENASFIWSFLPTSAYEELSKEILAIVESDCFHVKSFREFFLTSPAEFKKYFVHHESLILGQLRTPAYSFLFKLIFKYDSESIECIFSNVDDADRTALVFHPAILELLWMIIMDEEKLIPMVKVCLREAKLCKEDRERLKKRPGFRRVIEELYESHATANKAKRGKKRKLENSCSELKTVE